MLKQFIHIVSLAAAAALLIVAPGLAHAQSSDTQADQPGHMQGHMEGSSHMMDMSQAGSKMSCEQMQAKLDGMAAKVESTTGAEQQAAMAELLTTMVEQRKAMHDMMATMQPMMMGHMTRHVQSSGDQAAMGGMSDCPMMKMASDADEVGHSAHH